MYIGMKKTLLTLALLLITTAGAMAQKFALVDMEYIMGNIPAYERANEQLIFIFLPSGS